MPDPIFDNPQLAEIYDEFDGARTDLDHYLVIVKELEAKSVLDVGCGTGCFAHMLNAQGVDVIGVEPAEASLNLARGKPGADRIRWILGDATTLPPMAVDMAIMTGNVAQVFLDDADWAETLSGIYQALHPGGHLIFEVRDPAQKAWLTWTPERTRKSLDIEKLGPVETWCEVTDVSGELVSFRWTYAFKNDGVSLSSDSTLRFREKGAIIRSLEQAGYNVTDIRGAPDRPAQEFVFIAQRPASR